jgi:hypothetical protein
MKTFRQRTGRKATLSPRRPAWAPGLLLLAAAAMALLRMAAASDGRQAAEAHGLLVASGGRAAMPIVISGRASDRVKGVAAELAGYLQQMSGAKFQVTTGDGSTGIVLGALADFAPRARFPADLAPGLALRGRWDGKEAYAIRTEPKRLLLVGATDLGASHAAFRLLESLGCRWFFPGKAWEVVPPNPTLRVRLNETDRPAIPARRIWAGMYRPDCNDWARHNRMAASFKVYASHAWAGIRLKYPKEFEAHPEYMALVNGKRMGLYHQFCVSNPALRKIVAQYAVDYFQQYPDEDMVSLEPEDGAPACECAECRKLGTVSERVFGLANEAARTLARARPGKMVGILAYSDHSEPPSFDMEPNVFVQLTAGFNEGRYSHEELVDLWSRRCKNLGFYEYFSIYVWDFGRPPATAGANVPYLRETIQRYAAARAVAVDGESVKNWGLYGRGYYVANRLLWNPKVDVDRVLQDFYQKAFAQGAAPMQRYYEWFDPGMNHRLSEHELAMAFRDLDEAGRLAADRPDVQARLQELKQYMHYVRLRWSYDHEKEANRRKALMLAMFTHLYKTQQSSMINTDAYLQGYSTGIAVDFNEPTWSFTNPSPKPWTGAPPYTRDETDGHFREDLAFFKPKPAVAEQRFSQDLVPVAFEGSPLECAQIYQYQARYALYSRRGEPLAFRVTAGFGNTREKSLEYSVSAADGKKIRHDRIPTDTRPRDLEIPVPGPGLYFAELNTTDGWTIRVPADRACAIALPPDVSLYHVGQMQPLHFYVPKGTRQIQYFTRDAPHEICGPDGRVAQKVEESEQYATVAVPPGADGKPWSLKGLSLGRIWFVNVPNYLAASPRALLVPREVAQRDGLALSQAAAERTEVGNRNMVQGACHAQVRR